MTKPLRNVHLILIIILPVLTLFLSYTAIDQRQSVPLNRLSNSDQKRLASMDFLFDRTDLLNEHNIRVIFYQDYLKTGYFVRLKMNEYLNHPDILVYIVSNVDDDSDDIPMSATLLGQLSYQSANIFKLPELSSNSKLILYSLGHQKKINHIIFDSNLLYQQRDVN